MNRKMNKRTDLVEIITPKGIAIYPWLNKPDTKYDPNGVFKVTLRLPKQDAGSLAEKIKDSLSVPWKEATSIKEKSAANGKDKEIKLIKPFSIVFDEHQEETGEVDFTFKMKHKIHRNDGSVMELRPAIYDSLRTELNPAPEIYSGSVIRVNAYIDPYLQNMDQIKVGATLRLRAVQIIQLAPPKKTYGFGREEQGFTAESRSFENINFD